MAEIFGEEMMILPRLKERGQRFDPTTKTLVLLVLGGLVLNIALALLLGVPSGGL